jgi:hypothetical protein
MNLGTGLRVGAVSVLMALGAVSGQQTTSSAPSGLQSTDPQVRKAAAERVVSAALAERATAIRQFVGVVEANPQKHDDGPAPAKALALESLGALGAREELPLLVREIDYLVFEPDGLSPWTGRPAVRALIRIGLPAVKELLGPAALERAPARTLDNVAKVVRYVFPNRETARAFVEAYDPGYSEPARKNRGILLEFMSHLPDLREEP